MSSCFSPAESETRAKCSKDRARGCRGRARRRRPCWTPCRSSFPPACSCLPTGCSRMVRRSSARCTGGGSSWEGRLGRNRRCCYWGRPWPVVERAAGPVERTVAGSRHGCCWSPALGRTVAEEARTHPTGRRLMGFGNQHGDRDQRRRGGGGRAYRDIWCSP